MSAIAMAIRHIFVLTKNAQKTISANITSFLTVEVPDIEILESHFILKGRIIN